MIRRNRNFKRIFTQYRAIWKSYRAIRRHARDQLSINKRVWLKCKSYSRRMKFCQTSLQISIENLSRIFPRVEIPGRSSVPCATLVESVSINYSVNRSANYDIIDPGQSLDFNTMAFDGNTGIFSSFFPHLSKVYRPVEI